jgi:hypothetical protein
MPAVPAPPLPSPAAPDVPVPAVPLPATPALPSPPKPAVPLAPALPLVPDAPLPDAPALLPAAPEFEPPLPLAPLSPDEPPASLLPLLFGGFAALHAASATHAGSRAEARNIFANFRGVFAFMEMLSFAANRSAARVNQIWIHAHDDGCRSRSRDRVLVTVGTMIPAPL